MYPSLLVPFALVLASIGAIVTLRQFRASGTLRTRTGACEACGRHGPVEEVAYHQNTGMLFARESRTVAGTLCRACSTGDR